MSKTQVLVVANCQGPFIARALELLNPDITAKSIVVFQADKAKVPQYNKMVAASDLVFHFNVKPGFFVPDLEARNIKATVGARSKTITNLYFSGLHPDFCYVGGMNQRKPGPFGEYHSRFAIAGYKLGLPVAETAALIGEPGLQEQLGYRDAFQNSITELKQRDADLDIRFAAALEPMMKGGALPMFTFNHPTPWVLLELARYMLGEVGIQANRIPYEVLPSWLQSGPILPVYGSVAAWHGLDYSLGNWKQPGTHNLLTHEEAVQLYYDAYKEMPEKALVFDGEAEYLGKFRAALGMA